MSRESSGFSSVLCPFIKMGAEYSGSEERQEFPFSATHLWGTYYMPFLCSACFVCHGASKNLLWVFSLFQIRSQRLCFNYLLIPQNIIIDFLCLRCSARCWVYSDERDRCYFYPHRAYCQWWHHGVIPYLHQQPHLFVFSVDFSTLYQIGSPGTKPPIQIDDLPPPI